MTQDCRLKPESGVPGSSACVGAVESRRKRRRKIGKIEECAVARARWARGAAAVGFETARGKWVDPKLEER